MKNKGDNNTMPL